MKQRTIILIAALLLHSAFVVQLFDLPIWTDEASSIWFANSSYRELLLQLCDPHPPGYYMLLHSWQALGMQPFWIRLPSLFGSIVALALLYRLAQTVFNRSIALTAVLLLALFPIQLWYAAEVRMYALVQMMGVLTAWLAWQVWQDRPKPSYQLACWISLTLLCWLDYSAIFAIGLIQLVWLAIGRPQIRHWITINAATLLTTVGIWLTTGQLANSPNGYQSVFLAVRAHEFGIALTPEVAGRLMLAALLLAGVCAAVVAFSWTHFPARLRQLLPLVIAVGWLGLILIGGVQRLYTIKRLLMVLLPFLALGAAVWLAHSPIRWGYIGLTTFIALFVVISHQKEQWDQLVHIELPTLLDSQTTLLVDELIVPPVAFYGNDLSIQPLSGANLASTTQLTSDSVVVVSAPSDYRNLVALLPREFYNNYSVVSQVEMGRISALRFERGETADYEPPSERMEWGLLLPSPLAMCR